MPSHWPPVGAESDPLTRARQLQKSWERLIANGTLGPELPPGATAGLRPTIVESWRRSLATGLDPTDLLAPIEADESEMLERWFEHPLGSLTHGLMEQLRKVAAESRSLVVVTDASGLVLHRVGDELLKERAAEMNLVEGARYSEAADGTNGIGTALAADHAFQVFAFEHFNERHHEWVCSGAPVHDPVSGRVVALVDLSSFWKTAHPRSLELVTAAARTMEQRLFEVRRDQNARVRRRYGELMTRSTDLLVDREGYVLAGAEPARSTPLDVPEGGGEVVLGDGSVAVAASLGQGEAYLLRQVTTHHARSAPVEVLERAEKHVRELITEQAALRQVATLVARESAPDQLFAAVAEQVARVFAVPHVRVVRYEPEGSVVVGGFGGFGEGDRELFPIGSRWPLDSPGVVATVRQTGRPARVEDYAHMPGEIAPVVRAAGVRSTVASPIVVERRLWGAMVVLSLRHDSLPEKTEARLSDFTELVATAIANAESRAALARLAEEQAALRRVATLVASGIAPEAVFQAVAAEVRVLFGSQLGAIVRFEDDGTVTVLGDVGGPHKAGKRVVLDPGYVVHVVRETSRSARFDTDDPSGADMPSLVRSLGIRSAVASPIVVQGELWGALTAVSLDAPLVPGAERRLTDFTELVGTAVANAESREALARLADEQAALRRVATLVAQGTAPAEIFAAVSAEVDRAFGLDPATFDVAVVGRFEPGPELVIVGISKSVDVGPLGSRWPPDDLFAPTHVLRTGRSARIRADDVVSAGGEVAEFLRHSGYLSQVASPIVVDGRLWGAMLVTTRSDLPSDTEERLAQFTELVATAISNAESREALARLAEEQTALRRVATLVARDVPSAEVFDAVATEVAKLLDTDITVLGRYDADGAATAIGSWSASPVGVPVGTRSVLGGRNVLTLVAETGKPARVDGYDDGSGEAADIARRFGWNSSIAAPVIVEGRLWGVMLVATQRPEPFPAGAENRLAAFTDLVATAVANAQSHDEVRRFGDEQAALGRVATLVAGGAAPKHVFTAVVEEVSSLLGLERIELVRYEGDTSGTVIAASGDHPFPAGSTWSLDDPSVMATVARTRRAARIDDYSNLDGEIARTARSAGFQSAIGAPMTVEGRLWGVIIAISTDPEPIPERLEARLGQFTDLVGTAVANAESGEALARLAEEQAALRRVATLVARGTEPATVFGAVCDEARALLGADMAGILRFHNDRTVTVTAASGGLGQHRVGVRVSFDPGFVVDWVHETHQAARFDTDDPAAAQMPDVVRMLGIRSAVGSPIVVDGELWGTITLASLDRSLPTGLERRLADFTELVATAIANAESRSALNASRRRIVAASDETRRQIERDLHDGTQQRLVSLGLAVRAAEANLPPKRDDLRAQLSGVVTGLIAAVEDLQEISRGIHPAILSKGGLGPALQALAHRSAIPVDLEIKTDARLEEPIEVAAYFVASEALANAAKHSDATRIDVSLERRDSNLLLSVRDDGVGGADAARGSGIVGLDDRVEALGGSLHVDSRPGEGTQIVAQLPLDLELEQPPV